LFGKETQNLTAKLAGEKDLDGAKVWDITVSGKLNINADMEELSKASGAAAGGVPPNMKIKGTADVNRRGPRGQATGKTLQYTASVTRSRSWTLGSGHDRFERDCQDDDDAAEVILISALSGSVVNLPRNPRSHRGH